MKKKSEPELLTADYIFIICYIVSPQRILGLASLAPTVEHPIRNRKVAGSNPVGGFYCPGRVKVSLNPIFCVPGRSLSRDTLSPPFPGSILEVRIPLEFLRKRHQILSLA